MSAAGVPVAWRESIIRHLAEIEEIQIRIAAIDEELGPFARKLLITSWHMLSRNQVFQPSRSMSPPQDPAPASSVYFLAA